MNPFVALAVCYPGVLVTAALIPFLAFRWFRSDLDERWTYEWLIVLAALIQPAASLALLTAQSLTRLRPWKLDLYAFQFDRFFGEPSFALGRLALAHPWLRIASSVSYGLLSTAIFATVAVYLLYHPAREARIAATAFGLNLFLATPIYLLVPVCGPAYAYPSFPALPASAGCPCLHSILLCAAPNGIPSVHMSTALLVVFFLWSWPWPRACALVFAALTAFATLSSGEHYLLDLLAAVPYAAFVVWATVQVECWRIKRGLRKAGFKTFNGSLKDAAVALEKAGRA